MSIAYVKGATAPWFILYNNKLTISIIVDINNPNHVKSITEIDPTAPIDRSPESFLAFVSRPNVQLESNAVLIYTPDDLYDLVVIPTMTGTTAYAGLEMKIDATRVSQGKVYAGVFAPFICSLIKSCFGISELLKTGTFVPRSMNTLSNVMDSFFDESCAMHKLLIGDNVIIYNGCLTRKDKRCLELRRRCLRAKLLDLGLTSICENEGLSLFSKFDAKTPVITECEF